MLRIIVCLLFCLPATAFAQEHFMKTKADVRKELEQYAAENHPLSPSLKETDSTLVLSIKEQSISVRFTYSFDKATGKCNYQKTVAGSDSSYKKYLNKLLDQDKLGWKKINENQYVSNFADQLLLELAVGDKDHSFTLFRAQWTREFYDLLLKK